MTVSGAVLAPAGNTPATYLNINTDSDRLVGGGTVLSYLKQNAGDMVTWTPYPEFDGVVNVLAADNTVLRTISVQADLGAPGSAVNDLTVVALANGGFVLGWSDYTDADNWGDSLKAHYALYDDSGNLQSSGLLSSTSGNNVRIASLASGGFATVFLASGASHSQQGVVNTFLYNAGSGTYVKQAESYVGDPANNAPGAGADVTKLFMLGEADITALSDGGFVVSAPTYDWVSPTYTPLGDFIFNYSPTGAQENFASGNYWQRVNWNPGQINDVAQVTAFSGGFASLNRGNNGQWQATLYHDDGSLITTSQLNDQVYHSGVYDTRTYYANNLAPVVTPALDGAMNGFNLDDFVTLVDNGSDLLAVLPNAGGGFDFAHISKTTGALVSLANSGIAVPSGATLANPRLLHEGSGFDVTYDVLTQSGSYTVASTYQYGLTAPPVNAAPTVAGIAGDATDFIVGTPQYVDGGNDYADVYDPDSASFDGGYLNVHQTSGGADGSFSFDLAVGTTQILWGSGAQPDTANDGTTYTSAHAPAVGDKVWYGTGLSIDPADWTLVGTIVADGQGGHDLRIAFSNTEATIPAGAGINDSYASLLLKYLMYTAPTLGARGFAVTVNDGDGATSTPVGLTMTGTSDQTSTITAAATVAEPVKLPVSADSAGAAVAVFDFTITDAGGDGLATRVAALSLDASGTGDFSKVTWLLTGPGIGSAVTGAYNASTHKIVFASVGIEVAEGAAAEYTVKAYFADPADAVRGATYALSIDGDTSVTLATGLSSQMAAAQAPVTNGSGSIVVAGPSVLAVEHTTPTHSPTNADSLTWTVRFGEAVQHLDATDFDVAGLTGETIVVAAAGADAYTVTVSGGALAGLDGAVTLGLAAGQDVINADGQALAGLSPTGTDERAWVVDNTAPAAPGQPDLQNASDSGSSQTDDRTNVTAPTFTGSAEAGATVTLYDADGTVLGTAVATGGAWTINSIGLAPGSHTVSARAVDAAGNESAASATTTVVVDTSVAAPGLAAITDTGASATDGITKDGTVGVTLAADVAGWEYSVDGGAHWTMGSGTTFTLAEGSHGIGTVQVRQTDTAGNLSAVQAGAQAITVDTTLAAPAFALSSDTGASAGDGITQDGTVGVTLAGDVAGWDYSVDGGAHWTAGSGTSFTLAEGSHAIGTVQVRQTDTAGNVNTATNAAALTVATSVAAPSLALSSDTGASATDGVTKIGTVGVTLAGTVAGWEY
ncbi:MAG: Ig-like domain-containing protein, partial [Massilia sp.]